MLRFGNAALRVRRRCRRAHGRHWVGWRRGGGGCCRRCCKLVHGDNQTLGGSTFRMAGRMHPPRWGQRQEIPHRVAVVVIPLMSTFGSDRLECHQWKENNNWMNYNCNQSTVKSDELVCFNYGIVALGWARRMRRGWRADESLLALSQSFRDGVNRFYGRRRMGRSQRGRQRRGQRRGQAGRKSRRKSRRKRGR